MKKYLISIVAFFLLFQASAFAQTQAEKEVLQLSHEISHWETSDNLIPYQVKKHRK